MTMLGGAGGMRPRLSDAVYRRLTLFNATFAFVAILAAIVVVILKRDSLVYRLGDVAEKERVSSRVVGVVRGLLDLDESKVEFPLFELAIEPRHLRQIELLSQRLVPEGVLYRKDKQWFPGVFRHDGETHKVDVRIRGDLADHWKDAKKSLRVKFEKTRLFKGYRELNLVIPSDKAYEVEQVAVEKAREMGLLVPDSGFVRVKLNGVDMGLYYWYEQPGKEMLERLEYPDGELFIADGVLLDTNARKIGIVKAWDLYPSGFETAVNAGGSTSAHIQDRWRRLLALAREAGDAEFARAVPYLIDLEKFVRWNALTWLFGGLHAQLADNVRWYYDPTTGLFEPITYDVILKSIFENREAAGAFDSGDPNDLIHNPLVQRILQSPEVAQMRNRALHRLITEHGSELADRLQRTYEAIRTDLARGTGGYRLESMDELHAHRMKVFRDNLGILSAWLEYGRAFVETEIAPSRTANAASIAFRIFPDSPADLVLKRIVMKPLRAFPDGIAIADLSIQDPDGGRSPLEPSRTVATAKEIALEFDGLALWGKRDAALRPRVSEWRIVLELRGTTPQAMSEAASPRTEMVLVHALTGKPIEDFRVRRSPASVSVASAETAADPMVPLDRFLAESGLPFRLQGDKLVLPAGAYDVDGDVVIPGRLGLAIEAGVTLRMGPGASLVVYNALDVRGTSERPVRIEPQDASRPWGVVGVTNAKETSTVRHLVIGGGSEKWINGIFFSGQLNFYRASVRLSDSVIRDAKADDGLNVKHGEIEIARCRFENNRTDGFDGDWVTGVIRDAIVVDNGGDGFDFSGSKVVVMDSLLAGMGDKAISVGERTELDAFNLRVSRSAIGVSSKDLSTTRVYASVLEGNRTAIDLHRKKSLFGGGALEMFGSLVWRNKVDFAVDGESRLRLVGVGLETAPNHARIEAKDLRIGDIGKHYEIDAHGNPVLRQQPESGAPVFKAGPVTEPKTVFGVTLPNLAESPVGLRRPLRMTP
jgi:hypothetical protein